MKKNWYIKNHKGEVLGPMVEPECIQVLRKNRDLSSLFVRQSDSEWKPAKLVLKLHDQLSEDGFYIEHCGRILGPFTENKLQELLSKCSPDANYRKGKKGEWSSVKNLGNKPLPTKRLMEERELPYADATRHAFNNSHNPLVSLPPPKPQPSKTDIYITNLHRKTQKRLAVRIILILTTGTMILTAIFSLALPSFPTKSVWKDSFSFKPKQPESIKPTKEEWKNKLVLKLKPAYSLDMVDLLAAYDCSKKKFMEVMGKPDRVQRIGNDLTWFYECSDGTIQLTHDQPFETGWVVAKYAEF